MLFSALPQLVRRLALVGLSLAGSARLQSDWRLTPSTIRSPDAHRSPIEVPDTVTVATPATIAVWTSRGGCTRKGVTKVTLDDLHVTILLYDSALVRLDPEQVCFQVRHYDHRTAVIRFPRPGVGTLTVVGRDTVVRRVLIR